MLTKDNLQSFLRDQWAQKGETLKSGQRLGVEIGDMINHSRQRNEAIDAPYIDLWITVLDEFISWLLSLLTIIYGPAQRDDQKLSDFERSIVMILFKVIADTTSMRHLILLGFDGSARTLMRSISEYLQIFIAIIHDPTLASEFVTADTPERSNEFYFRHLARGKLHKRILAAWESLFGSGDDTAAFFANEHRHDGLILSGTTHPSFAGGEFATMHFIEAEANENWLGFWGAKTNLSVGTISIYASSFMPLLLLSNFPFEDYTTWPAKPIPFDPTNEMHRHVKAGRSVLASLILSLRTTTNTSDIYPEGFEPIQATDG